MCYKEGSSLVWVSNHKCLIKNKGIEMSDPSRMKEQRMRVEKYTDDTP